MVNNMKRPLAKHWLILIILAGTATAAGALFFGAFFIDEPITRLFTAWPPEILALFEHVTRFGESDWVLIPALVIWAGGQAGSLLPYWGYRVKWRLRTFGAGAGFVFLAVAVPGLVSSLLKRILGRARPIHLDEHGTFHFASDWGDWTFQSFPSGHTTTSFALATAIFLLAGRWGALAYIGAVIIGLSRIVGGVHYFSDVVAGALLGTIGVYLIYRFYRERRWGFALRNGQRRLRWVVPFRL